VRLRHGCTTRPDIKSPPKAIGGLFDILTAESHRGLLWVSPLGAADNVEPRFVLGSRRLDSLMAATVGKITFDHPRAEPPSHAAAAQPTE
jgi:hypothetical protein